MKRKKPLPGITDAEVQAKTTKTWPEWFRVLDNAGARKLSHKEIVSLLGSRYLLPRWWQQRITVRYEQERRPRTGWRTPRPPGQ